MLAPEPADSADVTVRRFRPSRPLCIPERCALPSPARHGRHFVRAARDAPRRRRGARSRAERVVEGGFRPRRAALQEGDPRGRSRAGGCRRRVRPCRRHPRDHGEAEAGARSVSIGRHHRSRVRRAARGRQEGHEARQPGEEREAPLRRAQLHGRSADDDRRGLTPRHRREARRRTRRRDHQGAPRRARPAHRQIVYGVRAAERRRCTSTCRRTSRCRTRR